MTDRDQVVPAVVADDEQTVSMTVRTDDVADLDVEKLRVVLVPGADDYDTLRNKPSIEGVELTGDRLLTEFGETTLSNMEIKEIFDRVFGKD